MTGTQQEAFREALDGLLMQQATFARALGTNGRTVRRWAAGESNVPAHVWLILRLMQEVQRVGGVAAVERVMQK